RLEMKPIDQAKLTPQNVSAVFMDCLYRDGEDTTGHVEVEGIVTRFWLNPQRLSRHYEAIRALLAELPDEFRSGNGGGGMSFLNAWSWSSRRRIAGTAVHRRLPRRHPSRVRSAR
ncbi:MAG TPA: hypothetical protein VIV56_14170, partial [Gemmatimonadales bacterium]